MDSQGHIASLWRGEGENGLGGRGGGRGRHHGPRGRNGLQVLIVPGCWWACAAFSV